METRTVRNEGEGEFISVKGIGVVDFDRVKQRLRCTGCYNDEILANMLNEHHGVCEVDVLGKVPNVRAIRFRLPSGRVVDLKAGMFNGVRWEN